jgi:Coenzyme PQQ synthesis protein D (PqqD)
MNDTTALSNQSNPMATAQEPRAPVFLVRNSATVSRVIAGETLVVPICAGVGDMEAIYTFNVLGGLLWSSLEQRQTEEDLIALVTKTFDVTVEIAEADIQAFLMDLKEIGLVKEVASLDQGIPAGD